MDIGAKIGFEIIQVDGRDRAIIELPDGVSEARMLCGNRMIVLSLDHPEVGMAVYDTSGVPTLPDPRFAVRKIEKAMSLQA
jgi:hypothetical protein